MDTAELLRQLRNGEVGRLEHALQACRPDADAVLARLDAARRLVPDYVDALPAALADLRAALNPFGVRVMAGEVDCCDRAEMLLRLWRADEVLEGLEQELTQAPGR